MTRQTILFAPGFRETRARRDYDSLFAQLDKSSFKVQFVEIDWRYTVQTDWLKHFMQVYIQHDPTNTILAGFSFGAVTALLAAAQLKPAGLWLFSLSPLFAECADDWTESDWRVVGKRRLELAKTTSLNDQLSKIDIPTKLFFGSIELEKWPDMLAVYDLANNSSYNRQVHIIDDVGHAIEDQRYVDYVLLQVGGGKRE